MMKTIKKYLLITFTFIFASAFAQTNKDVLKETQTRSYEIEKDGKTTTYVLNVKTKMTQAVKLEEEDKGKLNQDRNIDVPVKVEKKLTVDNYNSDILEVKMSYYKMPDEELRVMATKDGIAIATEDNKIHLIDEVGTYHFYTNNDLIDDIVIVEEFETIK